VGKGVNPHDKKLIRSCWNDNEVESDNIKRNGFWLLTISVG